jgi:hypothetical protein
MTRITNGITHQPIIRKTSRTPTQHTQAPAQPQQLRTMQTSLHITTARTPRTIRATHNAPTEKHTQQHVPLSCHTHVRDRRLPSVDSMLPDSWLLPKTNSLQDTRTAIASHHDTRRRCCAQTVACNTSQLLPSPPSHQTLQHHLRVPMR